MTQSRSWVDKQLDHYLAEPPPDDGAWPTDDPWDGSSPTVGPAREQLDEPDSWQPLDLGPWLRGEVKRPEPTIGISRTDGLHLIYPGKEHLIAGETEAGKSWFALRSCVVELLAGRVVVYVHGEESDPGDTIERLRGMGVPVEIILARFHFIGPEQPATPVRIAGLVALEPRLVVLDGVNELMTLHKLPINDPDGWSNYRRMLHKPFTAAAAAVVSLDHVPKDPDKRGRYPIGTVHKLNAVTGAGITLEPADPFGRGCRGRSRVFVVKDRPGHLRGRAKPTKNPGKGYLGEFIVDDSQTNSPDLLVQFYAPSDDDADATGGGAVPATIDHVEQHVLDTIAVIVTAGQDATVRKIRAAADFRAASVDTALERLVLDGRLTEREGKRRARIFTPTVSHDQQDSDA